MINKNINKRLYSLSAIFVILLLCYKNLSAHKDQDCCIIESDNFIIFFRKNIYKEAQRIASLIEEKKQFIDTSLCLETTKKTKIVLDSENAIINGYAYPAHMHFYTLSPQDYFGNADWLSTLVVHEYFHVAQFNKFLGFLDIPYHTIPERWLMEGDAVLAETVLSKSGRGRLPSFSVVYRTNLLSGKNYSFYQQYLGGPKTKTSDCYKVGYFLACYLRKQYGKELFNVLTDTKTLKSLTTLNKKLVELTGKSIQQHYDDMNIELLALWKKQLDGTAITNVSTITSPSIQQFSLYSPHPCKDGIVVYRYDEECSGEFLLVDKKNCATTLTAASGNIIGNLGSVNDNYILWTEPTDDILWGTRGVSYIQIAIFDIEKKSKRTINHKTRYMSAVISSDENRILTIECADDYSEYICILDFETGKLQKKIPAKINEHIKHPIWYDQNNILFISIIDSLAAIVMLNIESQSRSILVNYHEESISKLSLYNNYVLFSSTYSGIDNIYSVNINDKNVYQVVSRPFGTYSPSIDKNRGLLYLEDYQVDGMTIAYIRLDEKTWIPIDNIKQQKIEYFEEVKDQFTTTKEINQEPNKLYEMYEYPVLKNALCSWKIALLAIINRLSALELSVFFSSSDIFDFYKFEIGTAYNPDKNSFSIPATITIKSLYPIISLGYKEDFNFGDNNTDITTISSKYTIQKSLKNIKSTEEYPKRSLSLKVQLPLTFSKKIYDHDLELNFANKLEYILEKNTDYSWLQNNNTLVATINSKKAKVNIRSVFQHVFKARYSNVLYSNDIDGYSYNLSYMTVLPGLTKSQSISIGITNFGMTSQRMSSEELKYLLVPINFRKNTKGLESNLTSLQLDYAFPIAYPEWYFGNLAVDQIYAKLLFEYLYIDNFEENLWNHPKTIGISICSKLNVMGLQLDGGCKFCYCFLSEDISESKSYSISPDLAQNLWNITLQISSSFKID